MNIKRAVIAGIAGTLTKTIYSYVSSFIEKEQVTEPELLGTMLTGQVGNKGEVSESIEALTLGYTAHFLTGIGFASCYDLLWSRNIGKPNAKYGFIFGAVNGLAGISIWKTFLTLHPHPPKVPFPSFSRVMLINHVLFGLTASTMYRYYKEKVS